MRLPALKSKLLVCPDSERVNIPYWGRPSVYLLVCARLRRDADRKGFSLRELQISELTQVSGGANPHLTTVTVTTNPGGVVNKSATTNPNAITTTITFKTTGKPA